MLVVEHAIVHTVNVVNVARAAKERKTCSYNIIKVDIISYCVVQSFANCNIDQ